MGKSQVRNFLRPPSRQSKTFCDPPPPVLKSGNFTHPPYNMAKTSSYCVNLPQNFLCPPPPSEWLNLFPPPLFIGVKLHVSPLPFCSPPPPLSVISDLSLKIEFFIYCCFRSLERDHTTDLGISSSFLI